MYVLTRSIKGFQTVVVNKGSPTYQNLSYLRIQKMRSEKSSFVIFFVFRTSVNKMQQYNIGKNSVIFCRRME